MMKNQRGFTLIEVLIVVAITSLVVGGATMAALQLFTGSVVTSVHMSSLSQVQNAGYWISRDVQMAKSVVTAEPFLLTLSWTDWDNFDEHEVVYTLIGNELQRAHYTNKDTDPEPDATTIVADYISSIEVAPQPFTGGKLTLTITASVGSGSQARSETKVYEVIPRPNT